MEKNVKSLQYAIFVCYTFRILFTCLFSIKQKTKKFSVKQWLHHSTLWRGALGFSVLRIWPTFDSVFRFSLSITAGFRFWCLMRFAVFLQFNLWFSVFVKTDGGFSDSSAKFILRFFWFCQGSHSHLAVTLKL